MRRSPLNVRRFLLYKPREDGSEPLGTESKRVWRGKTLAGAQRAARRLFGATAIAMLWPEAL